MIVYFGGLIIIFFLVSLFLFRFYFFIQKKIRGKSPNNKRKFFSVIFAILFILISVPCVILFPFIIGRELDIWGTAESTRIILLMFGCFMLAVSILYGRKYKSDGFS